MKRLKINIWLMAVVVLVCVSAQLSPPKTKPTYVDIITRFGTMRVLLYDETPLHKANFLKLVREGFYDSLTFHRTMKDYTIQGGDPKTKFATEDSVVGDGDLGYTIPAEFRPNLIHKKGALAAARNVNADFASNASQFYIVKGRTFEPQELKRIENLRNQMIKSNMLYAITNADSTKARMNDFTLRGDKEGLRKYLSSFQTYVDSMYNLRGEYKFTKEQILTYTSIGGIPQLDSGYTVFGEVISGLHIIDSIINQPTTKSNRPVNDIRMKIRIVK